MTEIQQLVLVRQLAEEAERSLARGTSFGHGLAVSLMQDAAELLLRIVVRHKGINVKPRAGFDELVSTIDEAARNDDSAKVPHRARMEDLNKARVGFKHSGTAPSGEDAKRLIRYGLEFLEVAAPRFLAIEYHSVSLADSIRRTDMREAIKLAERALAEDRPGDAVDESAKAVYFAGELLRQILPRPNQSLRDIGAGLQDHNAQRLVGNGMRYLVGYLSEVRDVVIAGTLGIDVRRQRMFKNIAPVVTVYGDGRVSLVASRVLRPTTAQAAFCVSFATECAIAADSFPTIAELNSEVASNPPT